MKKFLIVLLILMLSLTSLVFAAGAKESAKPTEVWFNTLFHGGDAKALEMMVNDFNKAHDDLKIDLTQGSWTEYNAQLTNSVVAGEAPQIGTVLNFSMPAMSPTLIPLNDSPVGDLLEKYGISKSDYVDYIWDIANVEGKQYGIPLDNTLLGIYYNKDLFRKVGLDPDNPPTNLREFEDAANKLKQAGYYAFHPGAYGAARWYRRMWYIYLWQKGGELLNSTETAAAFNTKEGLEALDYLAGVRERGWNIAGSNGAAQFDSGQLGMMVNGTWHYLDMADVDFDWGFMGMPKFFEHQYTWGSNHFLVIPKQSAANRKLIEPAMEVIKWLSENSHTWGIYGGHVPIRKSALENKELRDSETWEKTLKTFSEMAFSGVYKSKPLHPKIEEINNAIEPYIEEAYNGTISTAEALRLAERDVNNILSK